MRLCLWFKNFCSKKLFTYDLLHYTPTVKTMNEESEKYEPTEFLKTKQTFFKDFCFKFEGLTDECEKGFTHIIKDLGGKVSKSAKYTLVEKSYSEKAENKKRKDLYHLHFILDCLEFRKLLDIELYRCVKICNENEENSPSILHNKSISYNNDNIGNNRVRNNFSNDANSDDDVQIPGSPDSDEPLNKTVSNVKKRKPCDNISSDNGTNSNTNVRNNFSNESNSDDDDIPISKMITPSKSQNSDETLKKTISKGKKRKSCDDISSDNGINGNITVKNNFSNESNSVDGIPISEMITPSKSQGSDQTLKKTISNGKKRKPCNNISYDNHRIGIATVRDNLSNETDSENDIPISERIKQSTSQQNDKKLKTNNSNAKKRKLCNPIRSDTESSSSDESVKIKSEPHSSDSSDESVKIKPETKSSDSSSADSSSPSNTLSKTKKVNVKSEVPSSSGESTNYESESEPSKRKKRIVSQSKTKTNSKATKSTWVDTKVLENNRNKDNTEEHLSSNSSVQWTKLKVEQRDDLKWLFQIDKNDLCEIKGCTFAPGPHESHCYAGRIISDEEKKIILQYLIKNNVIQRAKGIKTWELMISEGYLTHRSADTLRNCLRRVILPGICRFKLPVDIMDQFLCLEEKKSKGKKIW